MKRLTLAILIPYTRVVILSERKGTIENLHVQLIELYLHGL